MATSSKSSGGRSFEINGEVLDWSRVQARTADLRAQQTAARQDVSFEQRIELQESALALSIDRMLVVQEARRRSLIPQEAEIDSMLAKLGARPDGTSGCRADFEEQQTRNDVRERMMVDRMLESWRRMVQRPRADEVRSYYGKNKDRFWRPEQVHAAHIVCPVQPGEEREPARRLAEELRGRVLSGEDFGRLAARHSGCPEKGGDLGWFSRGVMVDEFDAIVFQSAAGELTPVFRTVFGFHFARVHARRPAGIAPLNEIRHQVEESLWLGKQDRLVEQELAALRSSASIRRTP